MPAILRLTPPAAHAALVATPGAVLLDVRDPIEFAFVGAPLGALNIPWKLAPDMRPNPDFLASVGKAVADPDTPLFLLCRSGQRSLAAAEALAGAGYTRLHNIEEGFEGSLDADRHRNTVNGWRFHGLPWQQG